MPSGRIFSSRLGTTGVAEFRLEIRQGFNLVSRGGRPVWTKSKFAELVSELHPDMPRFSTRKSSSCFLVWDYATKLTLREHGILRSTRKPSVELRWQQGKIPFYFKWLNYSKAAQTKRRSSQSIVGKRTDFGSQNQAFYRLIFSLIILDWSCD